MVGLTVAQDAVNVSGTDSLNLKEYFAELLRSAPKGAVVRVSSDGKSGLFVQNSALNGFLNTEDAVDDLKSLRSALEERS